MVYFEDSKAVSRFFTIHMEMDETRTQGPLELRLPGVIHTLTLVTEDERALLGY